MCEYSIVIPCYRSGPWIDVLVDRIDTAMQPLGQTYEVILVNDASPDDTWPAIEQASRRHPTVRGIDLLFNVGQYQATICGFESARGRSIITMDDDLQHPPEQLPVLIRALEQRPDIDCIFASFRKKRHSLLRNIGSGIQRRLNEILYGQPRGIKMSGFRIMRRCVAEAVCAHRTVRPVVGPLILRSSRRLANVETEHYARPWGRSGYSFARLIRVSFDVVISASTFPLQAVSMLGFASAFGSFGLGAFYLARYLITGYGVAGFATQVLLITFYGGMMLLSIGLLGEYLIRILAEVTRPPRYVVRNQTDRDVGDCAPKTSADALIPRIVQRPEAPARPPCRRPPSPNQDHGALQS
jgi:dolichol-phosphate mannosyltransferase/undecaprenyl-phosphate 4-deoxy-4-formamido-L-arabinose transferase